MKLSPETVKELFQEQKKNWDLVRLNYNDLKNVEVKEFTFNDFSILVHLNRKRIASTTAQVDPQAIRERKCFLCSSHLPPEQKGIDYEGKYQCLVNPYPIFPEHFTIPAYDHVDQLIGSRYEDMFDLAKILDRHILFYNGPKCGASAPDHVHFQAGNKRFLPVEKEIISIAEQALFTEEGLTVFAVSNYLRNGFLIKATDKKKAMQFFQELYSLLDIRKREKEPMMNILTWYESAEWYSYIIPRVKHRPDCFFAEGEANLLSSPGAVDMGGLWIIPLEKDFRKITAVHIRQILEEVCISDEKMQEIKSKLLLRFRAERNCFEPNIDQSA
jgi:hypothetical protein